MALGRGAFDGLPGRGQRLDLDDDRDVPPKWRAAFRLLKNAGLAPEWIELGREIDRSRYRLESALAKGRGVGEHLRAQVAAFNCRIGDFNLLVPHTSLQKPKLRV